METNELFEMCYELEDIVSVSESGYKNMYDITVTGEHTFVLANGIVSHNSAYGGISPALGREKYGYYKMKGKNLNTFKADDEKFAKNKELKELYSIAKNEGYEYFIISTDQDLDGIHIRGLLTGFFTKHLPEHMDKLGMLQTPVIAVYRGNKINRWVYDLKSEVNLKSSETKQYFKGLGTWDADELKSVIKADGLEKMIQMVNFDDMDIIDEWLGKDTGPRKEYIMDNEFNIAKY